MCRLLYIVYVITAMHITLFCVYTVYIEVSTWPLADDFLETLVYSVWGEMGIISKNNNENKMFSDLKSQRIKYHILKSQELPDPQIAQNKKMKSHISKNKKRQSQISKTNLPLLL